MLANHSNPNKRPTATLRELTRQRSRSSGEVDMQYDMIKANASSNKQNLTRKRSKSVGSFDSSSERIRDHEMPSMDAISFLLNSLVSWADKFTLLFNRSKKVAVKHVNANTKDIQVGDVVGCYEVLQKVGEGTYSSVFTTVKQGRNDVMALKAVKKVSVWKDPGLRRRVEKEVEILRLLNHERIVKCLDYLETSEEYCLITELVEGNDLYGILSAAEKPLRQEFALEIFKQLLQALKYLKEECVFHGDIKLENIILNEKGIKLLDFGLATKLKPKQMIKKRQGSMEYASPEVLLGTNYDGYSADLWASVVVFYALLTGDLPFSALRTKSLVYMICSADFTFPPTQVPIDQRIKQLIRNALKPVASERLTMEQIESEINFMR
jgi:serine/threonine protein kinase